MASEQRPAMGRQDRRDGMLDAALRYAGRGWRVVPLHSPTRAGGCTCGKPDCSSIGKHPRTRNGLKEGTNNEAILRAWWDRAASGRWPGANIGIVTGHPSTGSGLVVLDVDDVDGLTELVKRYGVLPETLTADTGGGGVHYLFAHPGDDSLLPNAQRLDGIPGLDIRGDGGYIVAAPSMHYSGCRYQWRRGVDGTAPDVAPLPGWLLTLLLKPRHEAPPSGGGNRPLPLLSGDTPDETARHWLDKALAGAYEGNRNARGFWYACQLRDNGVAETTAENWMDEYASRVPGGGYTTREATASLKQAYRMAPRDPAHGSASGTSPIIDFLFSAAPAYRDTHSPVIQPAIDANDQPEPEYVWPPDPDESESAGQDSPSVAASDTPQRSTLARSPAQPATTPQAGASSNEPSGAPRFRLLTDSEVEAMPAPEWLIHSILPAARLSVVYGEYGSCKSFLVLDWALSLATGRAWNGHKVKQGPVVYIAGEGLGGMGKRIRAWKAANGVTGSVPLYVLGEALQILLPQHVAALTKAMRALPQAPVAIVIDTLARSMAGKDENSAQDMGLAVASADHLSRTFGAHVLIVHHKPKGTQGPRGSNALPGAADTLVEVAKEGNLVTVACPKQKDAPEFQRIYLQMHVLALDEMAAETSVVLKARSQRDAQPSDGSGPQSTMLRILATFEGGTTFAEWQRECEQEGLPRSTFTYHLPHLSKAGSVQHRGDTWKLP